MSAHKKKLSNRFLILKKKTNLRQEEERKEKGAFKKKENYYIQFYANEPASRLSYRVTDRTRSRPTIEEARWNAQQHTIRTVGLLRLLHHHTSSAIIIIIRREPLYFPLLSFSPVMICARGSYYILPDYYFLNIKRQKRERESKVRFWLVCVPLVQDNPVVDAESLWNFFKRKD